jgi:hypothetical protein
MGRASAVATVVTASARLAFLVPLATPLGACSMGLPDTVEEYEQQTRREQGLMSAQMDGGAANAAAQCAPKFEQLPLSMWKPVQARRAVCDQATLVNAIRCFGTPQERYTPACQDFLRTADQACIKCVTPDPLGAEQGPLYVEQDNSIWANYYGCVSLLSGDTSASGCGGRVVQFDFCMESYCMGCYMTSDQAARSCDEQAINGPCAAHKKSADCVAQFAGRCGEARRDKLEAMVEVATLFCGK